MVCIYDGHAIHSKLEKKKKILIFNVQCSNIFVIIYYYYYYYSHIHILYSMYCM